jgi:hypothetical protein
VKKNTSKAVKANAKPAAKPAVKAKTKSKENSRKQLSAKKAAAPKKKAAAPTQVASQPKKRMDAEQPEMQHHDIIQIILEDHKPLKRLIATLKDSEATLNSRRSAFNEFSALLTIHAKSEERVLYVHQKTQVDMREEGLEGDVEHGLADQLVEIKQTVDKDLWSARVKVLAELVEHHIKEEEEEQFPEFKKESELVDRIRLGEEYLNEKEKVKVDVLHPAVHKQEPPTQTIRH